MASGLRVWFDHRIMKRALARWKAKAGQVAQMPLQELRLVKALAHDSRRALDRVILEAGFRLEQPGPGAGSGDAQGPGRLLPGTDWHWRPDPWRGPLARPGLAGLAQRLELAAGTTLFHDCPRADLILRQIANTGAGDRAPFGLRLEVFGFEGSFLSLVVDLPEAAAQGLKLRHLLRLEAEIECDQPRPLYIRLNIRHGPNVEQIPRQAEVDGKRLWVDFDMAYSGVNEKRIEKLWVDVIFGNPAMTAITLRDLTLSRRPRAEL